MMNKIIQKYKAWKFKRNVKNFDYVTEKLLKMYNM